MVAQNADKAAFSYHQDLMSSQIKVPRSCIDQSLVGPTQGTPYLIMMELCSKWLKVILLKFATTDTITNSLRQIFATHNIPKAFASRILPSFLLLNLVTFAVVLMSPDFGLHLEQLVENLKRKPLVSQEEETVDDALC